MIKKAIILLSEYPNPPNSGTRVKNFHLWRHFKDLNIELVIVYLDDPQLRENFSSFREISCQYDKLNIFQKAWRYLRFSHHQYRTSTQMHSVVKEITKKLSPDIIHAEELKMAKYIPRDFIKSTLTLHNVESELIKTCGSLPVPFGQKLINLVHAYNLKLYERFSINKVSLTFSYSEVDSLKLRKMYPRSKIMTTHNGVNAKDLEPKPASKKNKILFVGSLHYAPNADGIKWFLNHVLHLLNPKLEIIIAGAGAPLELKRKLMEKNITFIDNPPDLTELYDQTSICIVPILSGSGTRTKILEAQAFQRLTISTTKGAEGLMVDETNGVFIADTPDEFAKKVNFWASMAIHPDGLQIAQKARHSAVENYDWSSLAKKYLDTWCSL